MGWKDLAPWIAIAITLALSILVPLFTQIANNKFQLMQLQEKQKFDQDSEKQAKKTEVYERFMIDVGACLSTGTLEEFSAAGASIKRLYLYAPPRWHRDLDGLFYAISIQDMDQAKDIFQRLSIEITIDFQKG